MQEAVREQHRHLRRDGPLGTSRLPPRRLDGDHHVAERGAREPAALAFSHGEGQHVGRPVPPPKVAVERADDGVVAEENGQLRVVEPERREHSLGATSHVGGSNRPRSEAAGPEQHGHATHDSKPRYGRPRMFDTILITGDEEVAARVERTCKRLGVDLADAGDVEGTRGWRPDVDAVVGAAERTGAKAVHPGYVAPLRRTALARALRERGIGFVGPSTVALEAMQDKLAMRAAAERVGVRVVPGGAEPLRDLAHARSVAGDLGFPLVIKPIAGTAALGVEVAHDEEGVEIAVGRARERASDTFGDARVLAEKMVETPREIEVTVVVGPNGTSTTLVERETSIQRGYDKLIAESPSPLLGQRADGESLREALADAALRIATEIQLEGLATFEFLLDAECRVYFLEANADMHGAILATEMATGIDPIELQMQLASGEPLEDEARLTASGHAFEVRVIADRRGEKVRSFRFPPSPHGKVRFEPAVEPLVPMQTELEPLVARIATFAPIRHQALLALDRALAETSVAPIGTNLTFLRRVLNHDSFRAGQYDVGFTERLFERT